MANLDVHDYYAKNMRWWGKGHAFFDMPSNKKAKPGVLGLINNNGRWQDKLDLADNASECGEGKKYTSIDPGLTDTSKTTLGPIHTETVNKKEFNVEAEIDIPQNPGTMVPISTRIDYSLKKSCNFGAIVVCNSEVEVDELTDESVFRSWVKSNGWTLLKNIPDIKAYEGFYIMTTTYASDDVDKIVWSSEEETIAIGLKADAGGVVKLGVGGGASHAGIASGWEHQTVKSGEKSVLFFGGLFFKLRHLLKMRKKPFKEVDQREWTGVRGSAQFVIEGEEEDEDMYVVEVDRIG